MNKSISTGNLLGMAIQNNSNNMNSSAMNNNNNMDIRMVPNDVNEISTVVKIGIRNWQHNANQMNLLNFIYKNTGITLQNVVLEGPLIVAYVANRLQADRVMKCDGMNYMGQRLRIEIMNGRVPSTSNTMEFLRNVILKRYDPQIKMLNLGDLYQDQDLLQKGMLSNVSTRSRTFPALLKIASEEPNLIVESINLANNQLRDITPIISLPQIFPNLLNLCLANNQISRTTAFDPWTGKFLHLKELLLSNNSVVKYRFYKDDMLKIFPKLTILDNIMIRDETKLNRIYHFPIKVQQFFFETNQLSTTASEFVTNFSNCWDNDRTQLFPLYTPDSQFSISVDGTIPSATVSESDQTPSFGYYIPHSRNMIKLSNDNTRQMRLTKGANEIMTSFQKFPQTKHHLQDDSMDYKMEVVSFPQVSGFIVTLHGFFEEIGKPLNSQNDAGNTDIIRTSQRTRRYASSYNSNLMASGNKNLSKKCFDRVWVVVPMNNTIVIASEMLTIRAYTKNSWCPDKIPSQSQTVSIPQLSTPPLNSGLQVPANINMSAQQIELIRRLHEVTKLNFQYTCVLAQQSNWNYEQALKNFQTSINNLPKEAFIQ